MPNVSCQHIVLHFAALADTEAQDKCQLSDSYLSKHFKHGIAYLDREKRLVWSPFVSYLPLDSQTDFRICE